MRKTKYLAILAVAVMFIAVFSGTSDPPPDMPPVDGNIHAVPQYPIPPVIDGIVQVDVTWPSSALIGHMWVRDPPDNIKVADVYMMFNVLSGYEREDDTSGYGPGDEQGYYFYIGIKPLEGYSIPTGDPGLWVKIDWDQDGYVDFVDNNGNSATKGKPPRYTTQFAYTADGAEWAIPYIDVFVGVCKSPFDILVHSDIVFPNCGGGGQQYTSTFPGDRPDGPFQSTTICVGEMISPEPPEEPDEWGIRTIGFWKHQLSTALGLNKGHQHVPTENLVYYLSIISTESTILELNDMDSDMMLALAILELRGPHSMYDKGVQQLLATWLNFVSDGDQEVDTDCDDIPDMLLSDAIALVESILTDPNATPEELEYAKDICDCINNSGEE